MPRRITARTVTLWRERIERFHRSDMSVEAFCKQEGMSSSSFYNWRKKLQNDEPAAPSTTPRAGGFEAVALISSPASMSIHLPNGVRIEIGAEQLDTIRAAIGEVLRSGDPSGQVTTC